VLAELVEEDALRRGALYPPLTDLRSISLAIAVRVAEKAHEMGLARNERPRNLKKGISESMYDPRA
jgi:malate dehydrogenase (oxaloacetate-decarboxylating)(NADP+)